MGLAAVQIAKALGAKVIATAGSAAKLDVAKSFGADYGIDYTQDGWQQKVKDITNGHGADVVYDPVGLVNESLKCIAWNGRIIIVGFAAGSIQKIPANLLLLKNVAAMGVHWCVSPVITAVLTWIATPRSPRLGTRTLMHPPLHSCASMR